MPMNKHQPLDGSLHCRICAAPLTLASTSQSRVNRGIRECNDCAAELRRKERAEKKRREAAEIAAQAKASRERAQRISAERAAERARVRNLSPEEKAARQKEQRRQQSRRQRQMRKEMDQLQADMADYRARNPSRPKADLQAQIDRLNRLPLSPDELLASF